MIKNYLRSTWRNLSRNKFIAFINIFGLTTGITCCLLILTYIINELSYDKYNTKADRIYRVTRSFNSAEGVESLHLSAIAPPFGPLLKNEFPDIEKVTQVLPSGTTSLRYGEKLFNEKNAYFADENLFDIFTANVVKGNPHNALTEPFSLMVSEELAKKYFDKEDPINKLIKVDGKFSFKITGVFKAFPANSHFQPEMLLSFSTLKDNTIYGQENLNTNFGNNAFYTYILLPPNYNVKNIERLFPAFLDKYVRYNSAKPVQKPSALTKLYIQKLTDIHLQSHLDDEMEENGNITRVYIFSAIALFILLIACINYMNLSTARSTLRAKEIGIRKVIGALRKEIIVQFLSESVLITWIALVAGIVLTVLILPFINSLSSQNLSITNLLQWQIVLAIILLPFVIGLISGIYPALFMSSFNPAKVLKGLFKAGSGGISFRKVLVVVQFSISIILIVATTVVFQQLRYMQDKSLGFNKDHILTMGNNLGDKLGAFRTELEKETAIKSMAGSSRIPSGRLLDNQGIQTLENGVMKPATVDVKYLTIDEDFVPTYGIHMAAGRNFSRSFTTDSSNYILNEAAVKILGWKSAENALGKDVIYGSVRGKIIGVTKDFHFESLHQKIVATIFRMPSSGEGYNRLSIKVNGANLNTTISTIEVAWHRYLPETPFEYTFLDEKFDKLYNSERQQGTLFTIFSCLAIFIACLGLFGLSAFTITQRIKEIGVRKVLGASVPQIVAELSKSFLKLVLFSAVVALPASWFLMNKWLLDFAFRINISWWVLAMAGCLAVIIAFVTISFQSIRAANSNPVKSLRSE